MIVFSVLATIYVKLTYKIPLYSNTYVINVTTTIVEQGQESHPKHQLVC